MSKAHATPKIGELVVVRHGESGANADNAFAGWMNTPLSEKGIKEAKTVGKTLRSAGFKPEAVYSSPLERSVWTAIHMLTIMGMPGKMVTESAALLDRHHGAFTGVNRDEAAATLGMTADELHHCSYHTPPPPMDASHPYHPDNLSKCMKVIGLPANGTGTETLKDVVERVQPFFQHEILPRMQRGEKVLIVTHGSTMRALAICIEEITPEAANAAKISNAAPIKYAITSEQGARDWTFEKSFITDQSLLLGV